MLEITAIHSAKKALNCFRKELAQCEYYLGGKGVWYGQGAEMLGLSGTAHRDQWEALVLNKDPRTGSRLTARTNDTRTDVMWTENGPEDKEVENRRIYHDFTFSVPKSVSMYLAITGDAEGERLVHEAAREELDAIGVEVQTRVRRGGADYNRPTGIAVWSCFVHRGTRPQNGHVDPHWHIHALLHNATYDSVEDRWKAAQLGDIVADKGRHQAAFHSRVAAKLMAAGHRLRRTASGFEMDIFTEQEIRMFCKRTEYINEIERRDRKELEIKCSAIVKAAGERGVLMDWDEQYEALRGKLGQEYREEKSAAKLNGEALKADWRSQLGDQRWKEITREASIGKSIGFLEPEVAKQQAIHHAFEKHSVLRTSKMIEEILKWGIGVVPVKVAEAWVNGTEFLRSVGDAGKVTTAEVYQEDKEIIALVEAGKGTVQALDTDKRWKIRSELVAGDSGQRAALHHSLWSRDFLMGIRGKPGVGKTTLIKEAATAIRELTGYEPVMLAATAKAVGRLREAGLAGETVANFKDKQKLQDAAVGRVIWVDEASLVSNRDFLWLLHFARDNGCRLIVSGDPKQHKNVQRGHPFKTLIECAVLECASLEKIYRQQNAELKEIIERWYDGGRKPVLERIDSLGMVREKDTRGQALKQIVEDLIKEYKAGNKVMTIAPVHRDGRELAEKVRERMKEEGMLGKDEREITWLDSCDLSEPQRGDVTFYEPGQIVEFNTTVKGGLKVGAQYEVSRIEGADVTVSRCGVERRLNLALAANFTVYERKAMKVAAGERILVTKNNRDLGVRNGDLVLVKRVDEHTIALENGREMDITKPVHLRQGYSITSQISQGHERPKMFAFVPVSAVSQVNAVQMLVSLSRASDDARLYTDSKAVLFEAAIRPGQEQSAVELVGRVQFTQHIQAQKEQEIER